MINVLYTVIQCLSSTCRNFARQNSAISYHLAFVRAGPARTSDKKRIYACARKAPLQRQNFRSSAAADTSIPHSGSNRCFTAAVRAEIGTAILAAAAFPRLYGSFCSAFRTEFSVVLHSADAAPFITVPARNGIVFGSHAKKSFAVCHIL